MIVPRLGLVQRQKGARGGAGSAQVTTGLVDQPRVEARTAVSARAMPSAAIMHNRTRARICWSWAVAATAMARLRVMLGIGTLLSQAMTGSSPVSINKG